MPPVAVINFILILVFPFQWPIWDFPDCGWYHHNRHQPIITVRKRSLGQGNIFTPVCHSVHRGGMRGCSWGGMHGCSRGGCMVAPGGDMRGFIWGVHGFIQGVCIVLFGGACMVLFWGVCMVLFAGACVVFPVFSDTMRYGQWAGGMHPTGMHSCCRNINWGRGGAHPILLNSPMLGSATECKDSS